MIDKLKKIVVFVGAPIVTVIILIIWCVMECILCHDKK